MSFKFRGDIEVPQRIFLGNDRLSYITYESAGISLFVDGQSQFLVTADGATIADDLVLNSVTIARTGTEPIHIVDISNHPDLGIGLGLIIDNSLGSQDFRVYLPKTNTDDQVIFNPGPDNDTAIVKFKKNNSDTDGNIFTKYSLGGTIYDSGSDIFIGAIANIDGALGICQPINTNTTTAGSELDQVTAFGIVQNLAAKELTWDMDNRNVVFYGFHGNEVSAQWADATFTSTDHGLMVSEQRLLPVLWQAVRWLMSNYHSVVLSS